MKVLFLIPTLQGGGAERVCSLLTIHLSDEIERVLVLYENKINYSYKARLYRMDIPILRDKTSLFLRVKNLLLRFLKLKRIVKKEKPDVIMGFMEATNGLILLYKLLVKPYKIKFIVNVRTFPSLWYKGLQGNIYKVIIRLLYNYADAIVVNSDGIKKDLIQNFKIKEGLIKSIPNPYDLKRIEELAKEDVDFVWFKENIPILANMGRLEEPKGQIYLLRVFAKVKKEVPCCLIILGDGPRRKELEDMAKEMNISGDVAFLGFQKNPFNYLARSTIFVFPSLIEGFPNALVEAMACGIPVVSFDCLSGPSEILGKNNYGLLVSLKDEDALVKAILNLLKDERLRSYYKNKGRERVIDFSLERIIPRYEELFSEITMKDER